MRVLIGFDGSECSEAALEDLLRAGLPLDSEALVMSVADVLPTPIPVDDRTTAAKFARTERNVVLEDAAAFAAHGRERLEQLVPTWRIDAEALADSPSWALLQRAKTWKADLVVVGSHGRSAFGRAVFGSVAQKVLNEAPCSVRIARGRPAAERPGAVRLVLGADSSVGADAALAAILARKWPAGSGVRVVTAVNPSVLGMFGRFGSGHDDPWAWVRTVDAVATQKLAASGLDAAAIVDEGDPKRALVHEAESWGADCVFVGEHGLHGADRAMLGSVAAAVAARAHCSVEVVRAPARAG